ncbi:MAG: metal ABC transporter substrate-binding protein, partial [Actinomycetota bacterium]|nr:metal ABC transporter substrate-binding protein [Actinomycetota bacterium]
METAKGRRRLLSAIAVTVALLGSAACAGSKPERVADGRFLVVAGFYPLAEVAREVGGDLVDVRDLTPAGAEPHDLELTTDQVDLVEDADLVLYLGGGFQPAVASAAKRAGGTRLDGLAGESGADPHVWLDPRGLSRIVERTSDALVDALDVDDERAATIRSNATEYLRELEGLDAEMASGLADCERRVIVTSHDAFGRLAARYDLEQIAIAGLAPEAEPDPRRLAELTDEIRDRDVTTVFSEALVSPEVAETLAREAGVRAAV